MTTRGLITLTSLALLLLLSSLISSATCTISYKRPKGHDDKASPTTTIDALPRDAILERDIEVLTFKQGHKTTGRRLKPVEQLRCFGSASLRKDLHPKTVQCRNVGWNGQAVQWKCEAELDNHVKFGQINVACEGYRHSKDEVVLVGSCALEYELDYTTSSSSSTSDTPFFIVLVFIFIFYLFIAAWFIRLVSQCFKSLCGNCNRNNEDRHQCRCLQHHRHGHHHHHHYHRDDISDSWSWFWFWRWFFSSSSSSSALRSIGSGARLASGFATSKTR